MKNWELLLFSLYLFLICPLTKISTMIVWELPEKAMKIRRNTSKKIIISYVCYQIIIKEISDFKQWRRTFHPSGQFILIIFNFFFSTQNNNKTWLKIQKGNQQTFGGMLLTMLRRIVNLLFECNFFLSKSPWEVKLSFGKSDWLSWSE